MSEYTIITENRVFESEPEDIVREQEEKMQILGLDGDNYLIHFFESPFMSDHRTEMPVREAIECLAIKDGYDMVQFPNGNYGFVAYYNGIENGFEIIG